MALSRREMLAGAFGAAALWSVPGWAQDLPAQTVPPPAPVAPVTPVPPAPAFVVDWQGGTQTPETVASLEAQIALVKGLSIKPEAMAFFAAQPITVDLSGTTGTRATATGIIFGRKPVPPENPVLLHELLHRYHLEGCRKAMAIRRSSLFTRPPRPPAPIPPTNICSGMSASSSRCAPASRSMARRGASR